MPPLEDTYGVFQCQFCARQETSTPRILAGAGWDVIPYKNYNLCPDCEVRDWIAKSTQKHEEEKKQDRKEAMKDYDWHRPHRGGRNEKK